MSRSPVLSASRQTLVLLAVLLACPVEVLAADDGTLAEPVPLPPVVVTPTRLPTPENQVGSSITVIPSEEIKRKQERTLPDALKDVPGLNVIQTGGAGGQTSVFLRGANANQTKVFIDGIDATDPATGTFNFEYILTWDIDRVEVVRGPQSGLYGADAIGGVVNIITKTGSGPPQFGGSIEGGSFGTFNQNAGVRGSLTGSIIMSISPIGIRATRPLPRAICCRWDVKRTTIPTTTRRYRPGSASI